MKIKAWLVVILLSMAGAAQAQVNDDDETPSYRREPIDIPRFLNRQNNQ